MWRWGRVENERNETQRVLETKGRLNLELGTVMAQERFVTEMDTIALDDDLPLMTADQTRELFDAVHAVRDQVRAKQRREALRKNLVRYGIAAAAALVILPFAAMNVGAGRTAISNYLIRNFDKYSVIQYDQEYNAMAPFGWRSEYYPRWLPEGYKIDSVRYEDRGDNIYYIAPDGQGLDFYVLSPYSKPQLNSEDYEETAVTIGDQSAVLYVSDDKRRRILFLPMLNGTIQVESFLPVTDLCKIAESAIIS